MTARSGWSSAVIAIPNSLFWIGRITENTASMSAMAKGLIRISLIAASEGFRFECRRP
jgi:hypothetical protein